MLSGTRNQQRSDFKSRFLFMHPNQLDTILLLPEMQGQGLTGTNFAVEMNGQGTELMCRHAVNAQGIAKPVGILRVIHMAVGIQIRVQRLPRDHFFRG